MHKAASQNLNNTLLKSYQITEVLLSSQKQI